MQAISDIAIGDFVALNPPYPENERSLIEKIGMYVELYSPDQLLENLVNTIRKMDKAGIEYFMTLGFYNPLFSKFVLRDNSGKRRDFFRVMGHENCAWGMALDQMYLSPKLSVPGSLNIIPADEVLNGKDLTPDEAFKSFNRIANLRRP